MMKRKIVNTIIAIVCPTLIGFKLLSLNPPKQVRVSAEKNTTLSVSSIHNQLISPSKVKIKHEVPPKSATPFKPLKVVINHNNKITLKTVPFAQLPGWYNANLKKSLIAFQVSCKTLLKQKANQSVGSQNIHIRAGDWHPACSAALTVDSFSTATARIFFEKWFHPVKFEQKKPSSGTFTGYYMPRISGSLTKTDKYKTPIYGLPQKGSRRVPHYTREQIDNGMLKKIAPVIAWINSPVDRLFLEIEGAGVIKLPSGKNLYLGYAGENGAPYTSIGSVLIRKGIMTRHNASKRAITRYLKKNPQKAKAILHANKSFVFFQDVKKPMALGAKGMALTPGYSLAIDKKWIPLGAPLWLSTKRPDEDTENEKKFRRLMIAQDTGGAIRGLVRGDVYWGSGKKASYLGEHMKTEGRYWLLLPKSTLERMAS